MVQGLVAGYGYPVGKACQLVDLPPSTYYYRRQKADERQLVAEVEAVAGQFPKYGTRRVRSQLRRPPYGYRINRKRVQRIMRQRDLLRPPRRKTRRTTDSAHPYRRYPNLVKGLAVTEPDQVWVCDITYIRLGAGFVYLAIVLDVFTRAIRGWQLSKSLNQPLTQAALRMALSDHLPVIHHSDQGVHYAAQAYVGLLEEHRIQISMAAVGKPEENGYAERFMRTLKEEEVDLSEYQDFFAALSQIGHFIEEVYMTKRIHSSLGYLTPAEYEAGWWASQLEADTP